MNMFVIVAEVIAEVTCPPLPEWVREIKSRREVSDYDWQAFSDDWKAVADAWRKVLSDEEAEA